MSKNTISSILFSAVIIFMSFSCSKKQAEDSTEKETEQAVAETASSPSEWIDLLEGNNLSQWKGYLKEEAPVSGWNFDGDTLKLQRKEGEPRAGDIITKEKFENFELTFEFKLLEQTNSGIFYRVVEKEGELIYFNAPEFQILDNHFFLSTSDMETMSTHLTGDNYDLHSSNQNLINPLDSWNEGKLIINNNHVEHWVNGVKAVEYELGSEEWKGLVANSKFKDYQDYGKTTSGHIGLQDHGNEVWFRNIKIRTL